MFACVSVYLFSAWCPWIPEEGVRSLGLELQTGIGFHVDGGTWTWVTRWGVSTLNHWGTLQLVIVPLKPRIGLKTKPAQSKSHFPHWSLSLHSLDPWSYVFSKVYCLTGLLGERGGGDLAVFVQVSFSWQHSLCFGLPKCWNYRCLPSFYLVFDLSPQLKMWSLITAAVYIFRYLSSYLCTYTHIRSHTSLLSTGILCASRTE